MNSTTGLYDNPDLYLFRSIFLESSAAHSVVTTTMARTKSKPTIRDAKTASARSARENNMPQYHFIHTLLPYSERRG